MELIGLLVQAGLAATRSEARRAIEQGGVSVDGEKVTDIKAVVPVTDGMVLKKGKKSFKKIVLV